MEICRSGVGCQFCLEMLYLKDVLVGDKMHVPLSSLTALYARLYRELTHPPLPGDITKKSLVQSASLAQFLVHSIYVAPIFCIYYSNRSLSVVKKKIWIFLVEG
jgi:hypothetical protein